LFQRKFSGNVRRIGEWFDAPNFSLYILHQTYDIGLVDDVMGRLIWAHNLHRPRLDCVEKWSWSRWVVAELIANFMVELVAKFIIEVDFVGLDLT